MVIDRDDVLRIAKLSKVKPSEDETVRLESQFCEILKYMDRLNEVDTSDVDPLYSPCDGQPATRKDEAVRTCTREELLANSPADDSEFFVVPRIL